MAIVPSAKADCGDDGEAACHEARDSGVCCPVRRGLDRSALNRDTAYTPPMGDWFSRGIRE